MNLKSANLLPKPKAILLDWDNTLADSWRVIHKCLNDAFRAYGHEEWSLEDMMNNRGNIHHSLRESFPRIFGKDDWEDAREVYYKSFVACHLDEIKLLEGAMQTIENIAQLDEVYLAIVSNKTGQYLRDELKHIGINHHFDAIIGATDANLDKPHKDPLELALKNSKLNVNDYKNNVWMVGDSKTDIEAALNFGCIPVLFGNAKLPQNLYEKTIYQITCHENFSEITKKFAQNQIVS